MKAMLVSDFAQLRKFLPATAFICLFVVAVMSLSMHDFISGVSGGIACTGVMLPLIVAYSILANDEATGWAKMRETLPLSKNDIVLGRYVGVIALTLVTCLFAVVATFAVNAIFAAVGVIDAVDYASAVVPAVVSGVGGMAFSLLMLAVVLPISMRYGITRATRALPLFFALAFFVFGNTIGMWFSVGELAFSQFVTIVAGIVVAALVFFVASAFIACKLYSAREF